MQNLKFKIRNSQIIIILGLLMLFIPFIFLINDNRVWIKSDHFSIIWDKKEPVVEIVEKTRVGQSFVAQEDNLARIDVMLRRGKGKYIFRLKKSPRESEDLRMVEFKNTAQNYDFMPIYFEEIKDSKGKEFYFSIEAEGTNKESIAVFNGSENEDDLKTYINEEVAPFNLVWQVYYKEDISVGEFVEILLNRFRRDK